MATDYVSAAVVLNCSAQGMRLTIESIVTGILNDTGPKGMGTETERAAAAQALAELKIQVDTLHGMFAATV